MFLEVL